MVLEWLVMPQSKDRKSQDFFKSFEIDKSSFYILCDGAGGTGDGYEAGKKAIQFIEKRIRETYKSPDDLYSVISSALMESDSHINGIGESTCVIISCYNNNLICGSVGDSEAHIFGPNHIGLTENQTQQRLGSGCSFPSFSSCELGTQDTIAIGSDGLWNYIDFDYMKEIAKDDNLNRIALKAWNKATEKGYFDDFSIALIRR